MKHLRSGSWIFFRRQSDSGFKNVFEWLNINVLRIIEQCYISYLKFKNFSHVKILKHINLMLHVNNNHGKKIPMALVTLHPKGNFPHIKKLLCPYFKATGILNTLKCFSTWYDSMSVYWSEIQNWSPTDH